VTRISNRQLHEILRFFKKKGPTIIDLSLKILDLLHFAIQQLQILPTSLANKSSGPLVVEGGRCNMTVFHLGGKYKRID
jgi:hypothetical protein